MAPAPILLKSVIDAAEEAIKFQEQSERAFEARSRIDLTRTKIYSAILKEGLLERNLKALRKTADIDERFINECISGLQNHYNLLMRADIWFENYENQPGVKAERAIVRQLFEIISAYQQLLLNAAKRISLERKLCTKKDLRILQELIRTYEQEYALIERTHIDRYDPKKMFQINKDIVMTKIEDPVTKTAMGLGVVGGLGGGLAGADALSHWLDKLWQGGRDWYGGSYDNYFEKIDHTFFQQITHAIHTTFNKGDFAPTLSFLGCAVVGIAIGGTIAHFVSYHKNIRCAIRKQVELRIGQLEGEFEVVLKELESEHNPALPGQEETKLLEAREQDAQNTDKAA